MKDSDQKDNYWLISGTLSILQNFSGVLFGFASFFILVRSVSKSDFGSWVLFMSTIMIMESIRTGLIQTALIRYLAANEPDKHPPIITASAILSGIVTVLCVVLNVLFSGYLAALWDSPQLVDLFLVYNIGFILSGFLNLFNYIEQAYLSFKGIFLTNLVRQALFFLFVAVAFFVDYPIQLIELVWVQVFSLLAAAILAYFFVKDKLRFSLADSRAWTSKLFGYGKYAFGTLISSMLSGTLDQMMLGAMLSPASSGAYNIAVRIANLTDIPTNAMAVVVFPQSAKRMAEEGKSAIKYLYERSVGITLAILLPMILFLYFFADWTINMIAGERFDDSIPLLKITLLYSLLVPFGRQFGNILDSIGKTKITFLVVLLNTVINLGLNFLLIKKIGIMGAAYATLTSNFIGFIIAQIILKKEASVNVLNTFIYMFRFYPEFFTQYVRPIMLKTWAKFHSN
ncbi:flippase [Persicitalea jodogahamensis]|uniref:Stage V sporulation protein B n=1 Tax=Persicitalea jodogahamensis TaxID=402147 RepID=A0A8J3G830_9BACT|nr:flippase [Persicitalea jodogahamensis]GHB61433.1 stage V sporulation protein B [Persicitalea jodogahamensis]